MNGHNRVLVSSVLSKNMTCTEGNSLYTWIIEYCDVVFQMTNETGGEGDSWKIHFSFTGRTSSALQQNNNNPSNNYFWESTTLEESQPTSYIYILTQIFLLKDIETLRRIVLDPEEINTIVKNKETVLESLHDYEQLEELQLLTDIRQVPDVKCNIIDGKCFTVELPITDLIDPDKNLRRLLRDLQTYSKTVSKSITRQIERKEKLSTPSWEIIQIDGDSDFLRHQTENELCENDVDKQDRYSIIHDLFSKDADCYYEDRICAVEKRGTPRMTAEVADADNTDVSMTPGCHPKITQSSVFNTEVCNKNSSELRHKRVLIHDSDEESGCDENNNSFDCIKKSTRKKRVLLSDSEESDSGKNHGTHNNKKQSRKVRYKRVRTYDSDEVSDGDI